MLTVIWLGCIIVLLNYLLRWQSPILLLSHYLLLAALVSPFSGANWIEVNLVMLLWIMTLLVVAWYLKSRGISIDRLVPVGSANNLRFTGRNLLWAILVLILLVVIVNVWIWQAGVSEFGSSKRASGSEDWLNAVSAILQIYILHATVVLSIFRIRLSNPHVLIAIVSLLFAVLIGYLSSSRTTFIDPIVVIFFVRLARVSSTKLRFKMVAAYSVIAACAILLMAVISAERRGYDDLATGFEILGEQVGSELAHGISPAKDSTVWIFSESRQFAEVGAVLLGGFYALIPRAIWEGKPTYASTGPIAGAIVFRGADFVTRGAGIPISFPSEISLAFGSIWFVPGFVLTALLMILVAELTRPYPLLIFASFSFYVGIVTNGLPKSQTELILEILIFIVLARFVGLKFMKNPELALTRSSSARPYSGK